MRTIALLAGLLIASSAAAADMKPPVYTKAPLASTYNWSGVYIAGYADYGGNFGNAVAAAGNPAVVTVDLAQIPHGPGVGGWVEALYQAANSNWVLGVRAEIGYTNFSATGNLNLGGPAPTLSLSNATNYIGSFNAELGYTLEPNLLAYVTGGLGFGGAKPNLAAAGLCVAGTSCTQAASDTSVGFDIGAGLRYAIPQTPIQVFIEGQYLGLGSKSLTLPGAVVLTTSNTQYNIFVQKLGFTYALGK